jgi:DNA-binding MarR family transcriptional regulator
MRQIATKSQTTVDVYEFLSQNKEDAFTIKQIADGLGVAANKVTGSIVSLAKKGILTKTEVEEGDKVYKAYQWAEPVEFVFEEVKAMSDKSVQILQFLQENDGEDFTAADIGAQIGMAPIAVNGVLNSLVKKGLVFREEAEVEMPDGTIKQLKFIQLTPEGREYKF